METISMDAPIENEQKKALSIYDFADRVDQYLSKEQLARKYPQWAEEILEKHPFPWSKNGDSEVAVMISPNPETINNKIANSYRGVASLWNNNLLRANLLQKYMARIRDIEGIVSTDKTHFASDIEFTDAEVEVLRQIERELG